MRENQPVFTSLIAVVLEEMKNIQKSGFRNLTNQVKLRNLAIDLALVAISLRTSYLVDLIAPSDPVAFWSYLIERLRQNQEYSPYFCNIVHIFEPASEQSFIVNIPRLHETATQHLNTDSDGRRQKSKYPNFIHLSAGFLVQDQPPKDAQDLLRKTLLFSTNDWLITSTQKDEPAVNASYTLPPNISTTTAVAFAGILLDYAIAYVPATEHPSSILSNLPMDFYECSLRYRDDPSSFIPNSRNLGQPETQTHVFMRFSCPCLENGVEMAQASNIVDRLNELFKERLQTIDDPSLLDVTVRHETLVIKDSVTF